MNVLLIGSGAREHALARAISASRHQPNLFCFGAWKNPGIHALAADYTIGSLVDVAGITAYAQKNAIDIAVVGPEAPLEAGIVDALNGIGIRSIGPTKRLAKIETSKSFTRNLLVGYAIPGTPRFRVYASLEGAREFIDELDEHYVIKADGLMSGKGVKVSGEHIRSIEEGLAWCDAILQQGMTYVIEEKLIGQEFSLMSASDGEHLAHMPPVQDHKRAYAGDEGPNTGGMGSYSDANHLLPFLTPKDIEEARAISQSVVRALEHETGEMYKGVLYGGFMATKDGVKVIEYNARFGDPEAMNVLSLLETDFVDLCEDMLDGALNPDAVRFAPRASVCKYAVPNGYPDHPVKGERIRLPNLEKENNSIFFASVEEDAHGNLVTLGSRAIAAVGIGATLAEAEKRAEDILQRIEGPLYHREDIGKEDVIKKRVDMMNELRR